MLHQLERPRDGTWHHRQTVIKNVMWHTHLSCLYLTPSGNNPTDTHTEVHVWQPHTVTHTRRRGWDNNEIFREQEGGASAINQNNSQLPLVWWWTLAELLWARCNHAAWILKRYIKQLWPARSLWQDEMKHATKERKVKDTNNSKESLIIEAIYPSMKCRSLPNHFIHVICDMGSRFSRN